jgi:hypothetical protein
MGCTAAKGGAEEAVVVEGLWAGGGTDGGGVGHARAQAEGGSGEGGELEGGDAARAEDGRKPIGYLGAGSKIEYSQDWRVGKRVRLRSHFQRMTR